MCCSHHVGLALQLQRAPPPAVDRHLLAPDGHPLPQVQRGAKHLCLSLQQLHRAQPSNRASVQAASTGWRCTRGLLNVEGMATNAPAPPSGRCELEQSKRAYAKHEAGASCLAAGPRSRTASGQDAAGSGQQGQQHLTWAPAPPHLQVHLLAPVHLHAQLMALQACQASQCVKMRAAKTRLPPPMPPLPPPPPPPGNLPPRASPPARRCCRRRPWRRRECPPLPLQDDARATSAAREGCQAWPQGAIVR